MQSKDQIKKIVEKKINRQLNIKTLDKMAELVEKIKQDELSKPKEIKLILAVFVTVLIGVLIIQL